MNGVEFTLAGTQLTALGSGALWWAEKRLLCVSDLHLGKSERLARLSGQTLPPYDTRDTLIRLEHDLQQTGAAIVVCLGDSFDDLDVLTDLPEAETNWINRLQAGRRWIWIEGNHDPGPVQLPGSHLAELPLPPLTFRHIAQPGKSGEVSGEPLRGVDDDSRRPRPENSKSGGKQRTFRPTVRRSSETTRGGSS